MSQQQTGVELHGNRNSNSFGINDGDVIMELDNSTASVQIIDYAHHEIHSGSHFYILYSVASLGAMTTPDDMITLTFTTPDTTKWAHMEILATATAGSRLRLIEAPTGGAESATGSLPCINRNRNSSTTSTLTDGSTAGQVLYDATLATGGTTLADQYFEGPTTGIGKAAQETESRSELVLKQNTKYQVSLYGTATEAATIFLDWYEHTDKA